MDNILIIRNVNLLVVQYFLTRWWPIPDKGFIADFVFCSLKKENENRMLPGILQGKSENDQQPACWQKIIKRVNILTWTEQVSVFSLVFIIASLPSLERRVVFHLCVRNLIKAKFLHSYLLHHNFFIFLYRIFIIIIIIDIDTLTCIL